MISVEIEMDIVHKALGRNSAPLGDDLIAVSLNGSAPMTVPLYKMGNGRFVGSLDCLWDLAQSPSRRT